MDTAINARENRLKPDHQMERKSYYKSHTAKCAWEISAIWLAESSGISTSLWNVAFFFG